MYREQFIKVMIEKSNSLYPDRINDDVERMANNLADLADYFLIDYEDIL